jgi:hypothetical protein
MYILKKKRRKVNYEALKKEGNHTLSRRETAEAFDCFQPVPLSGKNILKMP